MSPLQKVVVIGGAAGLTSAHFASQQRARVIVIEKMSETGKKILMSGGTRCNVLPVEVDPDRDYFSSNRRAVKAVLSTWDVDSCKQWLEEIGLELQIEEENLKYFPKINSAKQVRDLLLQSCVSNDVDFNYNCGIKSARNRHGMWECLTDGDEIFTADRIIFATGGKSFPKVGTDGIGFSLLKKLGHSSNSPFPALTPLLGHHPGTDPLPGVSLQSVQVRAIDSNRGCELVSQRSGMLFTHKGFSGSSILNLSHLVTTAGDKSGVSYLVDWTSGGAEEWEARLKEGKWKGKVVNFISRFGIPSRLAAALCNKAGIPPDRTLSHLTRGERRGLVETLNRYELQIDGHAGYRLAEVTGGGIPLNEIDVSTMESVVVPGVFVCGELLDVFGRIGGFNFYWAWVTGRLAGVGAARALSKRNYEIVSEVGSIHRLRVQLICGSWISIGGSVQRRSVQEDCFIE